MESGGRRSPDVPLITSEPVSAAQELKGRERRYLLQMAVRVGCFGAAVAIDHWTRWLFVVGAVVLPYIAVVLANAGQDRPAGTPTLLDAPQLPTASRPGLEGRTEP